MKRFPIREFLLVCVCLIGLTVCQLWQPLLFAQSTDAAVTGLVTDPGGRAVPGTKVVATNLGTNVEYQTTSNDAGIYWLPNLPPGIYRINLWKDGFKSLLKSSIELHVQDVASINFELQVGSVSETVTVTAGASMMNTTDASVSTVIDRQFAENLPLNGRSFQSLIYLTPGVTLNIDSNAFAGGQFSVNGQRGSSNYWTVDGVSANIGMSSYLPGNGAAGALGAFNVLGGTNSLVSVDALEEFRIQTSTYAPEFGRTPGGQVSILTRSGTNQFRGALFDYFRNTVLDATDWFANANGLPKAAERQNDFGGTLGGPVIKDRMFFFFSYEGLRLRLPQTYLSTVPDLAARQNAIPAMQPYLNAYPLPNPGAADVGPGIAPFNASFSNPASINAYSVRIDYTLRKNLNVFGRYNYSPSSFDFRGAGWTTNDVDHVTSNATTVTAGATWTKSSQTVNDLRFNYSTTGGASIFTMDTFGGGAEPPGASLFPNSLTYRDAIFSVFPFVGTNMYYAIGFSNRDIQHQYNVVDTLSTQMRSHSLKFGVDYRRLSPFFDFYVYNLAPFFSSVQDMEIGNPSVTYTVASTQPTLLFRNLGVFAQDTWRFNSRLTLTYGLRWDVDFVPTAENSISLPAVTGFSQTDLSNLALAPAGTPIYNTSYGNVAPRIGAAYQISQRGNWGLVLRSGFGVFYDMASTEVGNSNTFSYPFTVQVLTYGLPFPTPPADTAVPTIVPPNATQGALVGFDPHLKAPYSLQWSVALEQALGSAQGLTVSYVGSSGRRLLATESVTTPNSNYLSATLIDNAASSNYNALQVQFQRRLSRGLQALASYTWAHSIDDGSYGAYSDGSFANTNANKGDSDFDIRSAFSAALTYDIPAHGRSALLRAVTGGWSTENILQVRSAPPVDVIDGAFAALTHENSSILVRPDLIPGQPLYLYGPQYPGGKVLNPNAFTDPPVDPTTLNPLRQGDLGRNALRAFGLTQWDFAVHRDFPVRERLKLQFRAEMFNILNHPNFAPYNNTFLAANGNPSFGQSTQLLDQALAGAAGGSGGGGFSALYQLGAPRSIQLALKLVF